MNHLLSFLLLVPLMLFCMFQPVLYTNAMLVEQALSQAIYETQKKASLQGRYDEELYEEMLDYLETVHHFDRSKVQIKGTENLTMRGERLEINITIPKPMTTVIEAFRTSDKPYHYKKYVMSEYVP